MSFECELPDYFKKFESACVAFTFFPQNAIIYCKDGVREVFSCHSKA